MADGHIVYQGDAAGSVDYFKSINYICPTYSNPADYFLKILDVPFVKTEKKEREI